MKHILGLPHFQQCPQEPSILPFPYQIFRSKVINLEIKVLGINTDNQLADQFTKGLSSYKFDRDRLNLMVWRLMGEKSRFVRKSRIVNIGTVMSIRWDNYRCEKYIRSSTYVFTNWRLVKLIILFPTPVRGKNEFKRFF